MKKIDKRSLLIGLTIGVTPILLWGASLSMTGMSQAQMNPSIVPPVGGPVSGAPMTGVPATGVPMGNPPATSVPVTGVPMGNPPATSVPVTGVPMGNPVGAPVGNPAGSPSNAPATVKEFPGASAQWQKGFQRDWIAEEKERHMIKPGADNKALLDNQNTQKEGDTYGNYTEADLLLWEKETERLVVMGSLIFHNADLLGSTNGTSCDMCHPDAEGTHAETYPKYQVQLGRVALLRDMSNWCLENPCRAEPMSGDDYRMKALEAYMQAQRSGKPMKYGKH